MSRIKVAIYTHLTNAAAITALVSTRVYPIGEVPTSAGRPYIDYQKITNSHVRHQTAGSGYTFARFQFNCWADSENTADLVADALRTVLDNYSGTLGSGSGNTVSVGQIALDNDFDDFQPPTDASQVGRFVNRLDFIIPYRESVAN